MKSSEMVNERGLRWDSEQSGEGASFSKNGRSEIELKDAMDAMDAIELQGEQMRTPPRRISIKKPGVPRAP